jgi:hypothetical protein
MRLWKALRDGITTATRIPAPLAVLFIVYLAGALVLTAPVTLALNSWVGHRLAARDLACDFDGMLMMESLLSGNAALQPAGTSDAAGAPPAPGALAESRATATALLVMIGMALTAVLLAPLPSTALGGGVLLTYVEGRFAWRRFLWGAWHWLFSFLVLAAIFALCAAFIVTLGVGVAVALEAVKVSVLTVPVLVLTGLVYVALAMTFEYARVIAVAEGTRNVFRALGRAVVFIVRQPVPAFGLYLLMAALGLALIPLYAGVVAPFIPFEWGLVGIAAQQLFIVARLWTRLARLAGEMELLAGSYHPESWELSGWYKG